MVNRFQQVRHSLALDDLLFRTVARIDAIVRLTANRFLFANGIQRCVAGDGEQQCTAACILATVVLKVTNKAILHQVNGQLGVTGHAQKIGVKPIFVIRIKLAVGFHTKTITGSTAIGYYKNVTDNAFSYIFLTNGRTPDIKISTRIGFIIYNLDG